MADDQTDTPPPTGDELNALLAVFRRMTSEQRNTLAIALLTEGLPTWHSSMLSVLSLAIVNELVRRIPEERA